MTGIAYPAPVSSLTTSSAPDESGPCPASTGSKEPGIGLGFTSALVGRSIEAWRGIALVSEDGHSVVES